MSKSAPFHPFGTPFCVESVSPRRGVHFSGLDVRFRRKDASGRIFGPSVRTRAVIAQFCRQIGVSVRRDLRANSGRDSGRNSGRNSVHTLIAEIFLRTSVLYPRRLLAVFLAFCCLVSCEGDLLERILRRDIFISLCTQILPQINLIRDLTPCCCCGVERFSAGK